MVSTASIRGAATGRVDARNRGGAFSEAMAVPLSGGGHAEPAILLSRRLPNQSAASQATVDDQNTGWDPADALRWINFCGRDEWRSSGLRASEKTASGSVGPRNVPRKVSGEPDGVRRKRAAVFETLRPKPLGLQALGLVLPWVRLLRDGGPARLGSPKIEIGPSNRDTSSCRCAPPPS